MRAALLLAALGGVAGCGVPFVPLI